MIFLDMCMTMVSSCTMCNIEGANKGSHEEKMGSPVSQNAAILAGAPLPFSTGITITKMVAPMGGSLSTLFAFSIANRPVRKIATWALNGLFPESKLKQSVPMPLMFLSETSQSMLATLNPGLLKLDWFLWSSLPR